LFLNKFSLISILELTIYHEIEYRLIMIIYHWM